MKSVSNLLCVTIFLAITACSTSQPKEQKPKDVLSVDQMISIMSDLQLVQSAKTMRFIGGEDAEEKKHQYFEEIYAKHEVTDSIYVYSLSFYAKRKDEMNLIYDGVLKELQTKEESYR